MEKTSNRYRWVICLACMLLICCTAGLTINVFATFQPYLIASRGLTNSQGSFLFTVRATVMMVSTCFATRYLGRFGLRKGPYFAVLLAVLSYCLCAFVPNYPLLCLAVSISGAVFSLGGMIPVTLILTNWFQTHRALAIAISSAGTGVATFVAPPIIARVIARWSLQTALLGMGVVIFLMGTVAFLLLRTSPADEEEEAKAPLAEAQPVQAEQRGIAAFFADVDVRMFVAFILIGAVSNGGFCSLSMLYSSEGIDSMTVSYLVSAVGLAIVLGKFFYGYLADLVGVRRAGWVLFGCLFLGVGSCCAIRVVGMPVISVGAFAFGMGFPLATAGPSIYAGDLARPGKQARTLSGFQLGYALGCLLYSSVPGIISDAVGSYIPSFFLLASFAVIALVLVAWTYRKRRVVHRANDAVRDM